MTDEEILREINSLPVEAQRQVTDFIAFMRQRYAPPQPAEVNPVSDLKSEGFVGMWRERTDIEDGMAWTRSAREKH